MTVSILSSTLAVYKAYTESNEFLAIPEGDRYAAMVQKVSADTTHSELHLIGHICVADQLMAAIWPKAPRQPRKATDDSKILAKIIAKRNGETVIKLEQQLKQIGTTVGAKQSVADVYSRKQLDDIFRPLLTNGAAPAAPGTI
jgi:hypothetical protein